MEGGEGSGSSLGQEGFLVEGKARAKQCRAEAEAGWLVWRTGGYERLEATVCQGILNLAITLSSSGLAGFALRSETHPVPIRNPVPKLSIGSEGRAIFLFSILPSFPEHKLRSTLANPTFPPRLCLFSFAFFIFTA